MRENDKALRKVTRDVERDRRELEREEKKLEAEIKKAAKMGNKQAATVLAKQLINVRKQKTRTYNMTSKVRKINVECTMWNVQFSCLILSVYCTRRVSISTLCCGCPNSQFI